MYSTIYKNSPIYLQNLFCTLYGYRLNHLRYSSKFDYYLGEFRRSQWYSKEKIKKYQNFQIRNIVDIAMTNVPLYKEKYSRLGLRKGDIKSIADIKQLPILTKEEIRSNFNNLVNPSIAKRKLILMHTSGSTGTALSFYRSKDSIKQQWALNWRFRERFGITRKDVSCNFTGKLVVPINQNSPPFWRYNAALKQYLINMQHIKEKNATYYENFLNTNNITFYSGYPSIIYQFARILKNSKLLNYPKIIFVGAETLFDYQKELIERVFKCPITEIYGSSEGVANASKCELGNFHEDFEFGLLECFDKTTISTNEFSGKILATGFSEIGFPFIRYEIGDTAIWDSRSCNCGRKSQRLKSILGRNEDYVITPEGTKIQRFDYLFKNQPNIRECQIVQEKLNEITFRLVKEKSFTNNDMNLLINTTKKWVSPTIKIKFEYPSIIQRTKAGKFRAVISNINHNGVNNSN